MLERLKRLLGMTQAPHQNGDDSAAVMISCDDVRSSLFEYIDQELDPQTAAGVKMHLDACPECYPLARFEAKFVEAIQRVTSQVGAGKDLEQRILDALAEESPPEE